MALNGITASHHPALPHLPPLPGSTYPRTSPFNLGAIFNVKGRCSICPSKIARCRPRCPSDLRIRGSSQLQNLAILQLIRLEIHPTHHHVAPGSLQRSRHLQRQRAAAERSRAASGVRQRAPNHRASKSRNLANREISQHSHHHPAARTKINACVRPGGRVYALPIRRSRQATPSGGETTKTAVSDF